MWAQVANLFAEARVYMPWVSFAAGLGGGLHCIGMCGGLVTASCNGSRDIIRYQFGRLIGYVLLGGLAGALGGSLRWVFNLPWPGLIGTLILGGMFIFWGWESWRGRKAELPLPKFLTRCYSRLWGQLIQGTAGGRRSLLVGLISIFLPCGLLYGIVLSTVALQEPLTAMLSMVFFWLGTVPSMVLAPQLLRRVLAPLRSRVPKLYGLTLLMIGMLTIGVRALNYATAQAPTPKESAQQKMTCH